MVGAACAALALVGAPGCTGAKRRAGQVQNPGEVAPPPPYPTSFTPPPPLPAPLPAGADHPGLPYLQQIHDQLGAPWATFLEDCRLRLPPTHPLNQAELAVLLDLAVGKGGELAGITVQTPSGVSELDTTAIEIVRDMAPFPAPPAEWLSDDDLVHVSWLFARDRRQAGVATATLERIEWAVTRAVPKFLASGDVTTAARRLERAARADKGNASGDELLGLGRQLATAAVRDALRAKDSAAQRVGVAAARAAKLLAAAPELRAIIDTSVDVSLRGQAIAAVGVIGDQGAGPVLVGMLEAAKGSRAGERADNSAAAARALAAIGQREVAKSTVMGWFSAEPGSSPKGDGDGDNDGDSESRWAALVVMAEFPVPEAIAALGTLLTDKTAGKPVRMAACTALGTALGTDPGASKPGAGASQQAQGIRFLQRGVADEDAAVRAACTRAVARAAGAGMRSRALFWKVVELMKKDRDERVRAAATLASARLEPSRFDQEMYVLRKEKSKLVLGSLADALAAVTGPAAVTKLVSLLGNGDPMVRRRAAASLGQQAGSRGDARARAALAALAGDSDPDLRAHAARAIRDEQVLATLRADPAPEVRTAAFGSQVAIHGQRATLAELAAAIAASEPGSALRAMWAQAWLGQ